MSALRWVLSLDSQLVARYRAEFSEFDAARADAAAAAAREAEQVSALAEARADLRAEREQKDVLLAAVRADRAASRALLVELERAARALEETVARLGGDATGSARSLTGSGFDLRRGELIWPVPGRVMGRFGRVVDAEFGTETLRNGIEIAAATGDRVQAVAPGVVRFAGWFRGYGRIAILDHGDGYFSVSGHLDEIAVGVGDVVESGDTLGTAGETGSLAGPNLYFELRNGAKPVDPLEWLTPRE
jgi:septal ring factor EnvC (AmiA/AmiB activator)